MVGNAGKIKKNNELATANLCRELEHLLEAVDSESVDRG